MTSGALASLLVEEKTFSEDVAEQLYELLSDFVKIGSVKGEILVQPPFDSLDAERKVLIVILAAKAAFALGVSTQEGLRPKEIEGVAALPGGTVRPRLKALLEQRLVIPQNGQYCFPVSAISRAKNLLRKSQ